MDYEKAYKEALEIARKINSGEGVETLSDWSVCETIFPVLREDYDDMIRGAIIDHLKDNNLTEWADWLEKQKSIDVLDKEEREFADNVDAFRKEIDAAYQRGYEEGKRQSKCKFSVGDIVKHSLYDTLYYIVKSIDLAGDYELECLNGKSGNNIAAATEDYMSLWTIKDAKPGDVLACESGWTCIFKSLVDDETFSSYCFMDNTKWFCETGGCCHTLKEEFVKAYNGKIHPATKEQRDTLIQAMTDAGYTFDFKEKVLKKIEQNTAWSEEDERMYRGLHNLIYSTPYCDSRKELSDWLKSFKDRVQSQPQQEWSEEDEANLNEALSYIKDDALKEFIKSLRPQKQWKPSEEQINIIHTAAYIKEMEYYGGLRENLLSIYEQLKQL